MVEEIGRIIEYPFQGCTGRIADSPAIIIENGKVIYARYDIYCATEDCPLMDAEESGVAEIKKPYNSRTDFQSSEALSNAIWKIERQCPMRSKCR